MYHLIPDGATRIAHRLGELLRGQLHNMVPDLAVFCEVIIIEMAKGICVQNETLLSVGREAL
jgi:hypothetical protein